jgi:dihydroorotate dehydrogenase (NAD+) catalytic subunit
MAEKKIKIAGIEFKNPIWTASGTFGSGVEFRGFFSLGEIGAIVTKTVTLEPRTGNAPPRVVETAAGLLNSIGLENKGAEYFKRETAPALKNIGTKVIVSVAGENGEEISSCVGKIVSEDFPAAIELNLSCPNVSHGVPGRGLISQDPGATEKIIRTVKKNTERPLIAKLTPNVTDITEIASAAESGGADAVSLVNTYMGLAIDPVTRRPLLGNVTGGLSGPAIKPLALKAVWDVFNKVSCPVIGIGGIMSGKDVAEFMLAGAACVEIGTASLASPDAAKRILDEFDLFLDNNDLNTAEELIGRLKV